MATYSRTTNTPATTQTSQPSVPAVRTSGSSNSAQMNSRELGEIIVRSLETVEEALGGGDVPVGYEQIEKAVTSGINKSILGKQSKGSLAAVKNGTLVPSGSASDKALAQYWEQKKYQDWKKEQERQKKLDDEERKRREENWNKKVDEAFANINHFSNNPLKGLSDALDKGVKGLFKSVGTVMNKSLGEVGNDIKKGASTVKDNAQLMGKIISAPAKGIANAAIYGAAGISVLKDRAKGSSQSGSPDMASLVSSDEGADTAMKNAKASSEMAALVDENEEEEKKKDEEQEKQTEKLGELTKGQEEQKKMSDVKLGVIIGSIAAIAAAIPAAAGVILPILNNIPFYLKDMGVKFGALLKGPNSILAQIKLSLEETLSKVRILGQPIYGSLSKDEKKELKELKKDKDIKAYKNQQDYINRLDEELMLRNDNLGFNDINPNDFDLDTMEGQNKYKNTIRARMYKSGQYSEDEINEYMGGLHYALTERAGAKAKLSSMADNIDSEKLETYLDLEERNSTTRDKKYYEKKREEMAEAQADYIKEKQAEWMAEDINAGKVSSADMMMYKPFMENERLQEKVVSGEVNLANLRENSKFENMGVQGKEYIGSWENMLKNLWNNTIKQTIDANKSSTTIQINDTAKSAMGR